MALSGLEVLGSFLTGVQEQSQKYDEDLAKRIKEVGDKKPNALIKEEYLKEVDKYNKDKIKYDSIMSAYAAGDHALAQQILGGYDSMEDYRKALGENKDLYYQMFDLGDAPVYTPADYGLTNVRDDGSQITTSGQMFDQFFRPEVHKARSDERVTPTVTAESATSYRRTVDADGNKLNPRSEEDITESKSKISSLYTSMTSQKEHDSKKDELETVIPDPENKGQFIKVTLTKNASYKETGKSAMDVAVNKHTGDVGLFKGYSASNWVNYEQAGAIPNGSEMEFVRQGVIVDKNDNILEQDMFLSTSNGESIDGRRFANVKVKAQRTGNPEDTIVMNGETLTGWRYMHELVEAEPAIARKAELTLHRQNTDDEGNDLLGTTKYTLTLTSDGSTGKTAKTFGVGENGHYIYKGYQVTDTEENFDVSVGTIQDYIEQRWVHNGEIIKSPYRAHDGKRIEGAELLDVKFKAKFTGEDSDSITYVDGTKDVGYKLIGQDIQESTDTRTESSKKLTEQAERIMTNAKYLNYDPILVHMGIVGDDDKPLELNMDIARIMAERFNALNVTLDGDIVDKYMAQFAIPTPLYDLKPEGWSTVTRDDIEDYSLGYFGKIPETKYYNDMEKPKNYMLYINSKARTWANAYYMDEAQAVSVVERIALLGVHIEPGNVVTIDNDLEFNQFGAVHVNLEKNKEYTLDDIFSEARRFKNLDSQRPLTWHQSLTKFFERLGIDEASLKELRNSYK